MTSPGRDQENISPESPENGNNTTVSITGSEDKKLNKGTDGKEGGGFSAYIVSAGYVRIKSFDISLLNVSRNYGPMQPPPTLP
jgi:hypothetical protein